MRQLSTCIQRSILRRSVPAAVLALGLGAALGAGPRAQGPEGGGEGVSDADKSIDPEAVAVMRRTLEFLASVEQFTVRAEAWSDVMLDADESIQYESMVELAVKRPHGLNIEVRGDVEDRELWYDGDSVSVLYRQHGLYATIPARDSIDETLDHLAAAYELVFPLQDLALGAGNKERRSRVLQATYLGIHTAGGVPCHHVLWSEPEVDVQVWIETGDRPIPRRFVVDDKNLPTSPRYQATLKDWNLSAELADERFAFTPPEGAQEVPVIESRGQPR